MSTSVIREVSVPPVLASLHPWSHWGFPCTPLLFWSCLWTSNERHTVTTISWQQRFRCYWYFIKDYTEWSWYLLYKINIFTPVTFRKTAGEQTRSDLNYIGSISRWYKVKRESLLLPEAEASLRDLHVSCRCGKTIAFVNLQSTYAGRTIIKKNNYNWKTTHWF